MPLINVDVIENVFTPDQKAAIARKLTDAMVEIEGPALRAVTWVKINEVKEGHWAIGGQTLSAEDVRLMQVAGEEVPV